jgi:hypothetical protein
MSILNYNLNPSMPFEQSCNQPLQASVDNWSREPLGDLKHGLDLIFELKKELDKLHPIASETLIRLLSH